VSDAAVTASSAAASAAPLPPVARSLRGYARWRWWELALFAALPLSWLLLPSQALLLNEIAIVALFAISLDLVLGYAGVVSLGHAAFFGFGAYGAALFAKHVMSDPLIGMAFAIAISALLGAATSVLIVCVLIARRIVHSPFGISLQALRDNRLRATSIGLSVHARLVAVYTIAAAIAGAAGALLAQTTGFASLDVFDFHRSAEVLLVLVIGGTGYLWGGVIGAIGFKLMQDLLSSWTPQYWTF